MDEKGDSEHHLVFATANLWCHEHNDRDQALVPRYSHDGELQGGSTLSGRCICVNETEVMSRLDQYQSRVTCLIDSVRERWYQHHNSFDVEVLCS